MGTKTSKTRRVKGQATASVTPPAKTTQTAEPAPPKSIRQTIRQGILGNMSTKDLTVILQANFPGSQAAAKPAKHIAHYRCLLKKERAGSAVQAVQGK